MKTWISCCTQSQVPAHNFVFISFQNCIYIVPICNKKRLISNFGEKKKQTKQKQFIWSNHLVKVLHNQINYIMIAKLQLMFNIQTIAIKIKYYFSLQFCNLILQPVVFSYFILKFL